MRILRHLKRIWQRSGFDFIRHVSWYTDNLNLCAYYWNWLSLLREFMNSPHSSLLLLDDRMLKINWPILRESVAFLHRSHPPFRILQLGWATLWKGERERIEPVSGLVAKGIRSSGDYATVFSPEGAEWMYEELVKTRKSPEPFFFELSQAGVDNTGMFHTIKSQVESVPFDWGDDLC